jgi:hypothetical protein
MVPQVQTLPLRKKPTIAKNHIKAIMTKKIENIINTLEKAIITKDSGKIRESISGSGIIEIMKHVVEKDCNSPLFRVRSQSTREKFPCSNIDHFSYNPNPNIGRCNIENEPFLYTALESKTAVQEMIREEHVGNNIWLSLWLSNKPIRCLVFLFDPSEIEDIYTRKMHNDIVDNLKLTDSNFEENLPLYQWVSRQFLSEDYSFSSQLCHELFKAHDIDGIIYPSYAGKSHGLNLVLTKNFADNQVFFQDILSLKIHEWNFAHESKYMILGQSEIHENGDIQWTAYGYQTTAPYITERRVREKSKEKGKIQFDHNFSIMKKKRP